MNEKTLAEIGEEISRAGIRHGTCSVDLTFHDGRIVFYVITTSVRRNVITPAQKTCSPEDQNGK